MFYEAIDTLCVAVADLTGASAVYGRFGLQPRPLDQRGVQGCSFRVGKESQAVTTALLAGTDSTDHPLHEAVQQALAAGRGLFAVGVRVRDLSAAVGHLATRGVPAVLGQVQAQNGEPGADLGWLPIANRAGTDLLLIQHARPFTERHVQTLTAGEFGHNPPLKRLDHLAAVAPDLDGQTRFWVEVLGVPLAGEVTTPALVIRQFRIGDAVLELLGAASPDSPLHQRPAGLVSLASWEVDHLDDVVQRARAAGFRPSDPATGVLPGTRTATIPAPELSGLTMQLLEYF